MHPSRIFFLLSVLLLTVSCASRPPERIPTPLPVGTLSAAEVHALFIDRTVNSVTINKNRESVSYYDPNGQVRQLRNGAHRDGLWRITKNGRICLQMEAGEESCRAIARQNGNYLKFVIKQDGKHTPVVRYLKFRDGNPLKL